jgi:predicted nucleotidyltransferase
MSPGIRIDRSKLTAFCKRWNITEFAVFGSVLRDDFRPDSDVDVLVTFGPGGGITFDNRVDMLDELQAIIGREVDLVEKKRISNPFRRHSILTNREILYAA